MNQIASLKSHGREGRLRSFYFCLPWMLLGLAGLVLAQDTLGFWRTSPVILDGIHAENGFCRTASIPAQLVVPAGRLPFLSVLEDGRPIGSATGDQNGVRKIGRGLFAAWDTTLFFSTSDNSDPGTNHRRYEIAGPVQLPAWLVSLTLVLAAAAYLSVYFFWPPGRAAHGQARGWEWTALALIVLIGGLWRAKMPAMPLAWPDSWMYSSMSFEWESRHVLVPTLRELCYQLFVLGVMHLGQSPAFLVGLQHALGLVAAGLLFVAIRGLRDIVPVRPWVGALIGLLALVAAMAWALSSISIFYELYLMPEAVFPTLSAAALALGVAAFRPAAPTRRAALWTGVLAAGSAFMMLAMYTTIPRWGFGVVLAPIVLFCALRRTILSTAARVGFFLALFGLFLVLVAIPNAVLQRRQSPRGNYFLQMHLFCVQAGIILTEVDNEATMPMPRFPPKLLAKISADIRRELARYAAQPSGPTPSLHFNVDQLMYEDSVIADLRREFGDDPPKIRAFAMYFYLQAWRHQPLAMLHKITGQMINVFGNAGSLFDPTGYQFIATDDIPVSQRVLEGQIAGHAGAGPWGLLPTLYSRAMDDRTVYSPTTVLRTLHDLAGRIYLPVFICCTLWATWAIGWRRSTRLGGAWSAIAPVAFLGFAGNFLSCLTIAVIHTLDPGRYRESQMIFSLYAVTAGAVALLIAADSLILKQSQPEVETDSPGPPRLT